MAEDGRVNKTGMDIRPGVRKMFEAQTFSIFTNGIRKADGTISKWSEQPVNMQALDHAVLQNLPAGLYWLVR